MANINIIPGKAQFNAKAAKSFRDTMALWHVYDFELADLRKKKLNEVKNHKGIIATNLELIAKKNFSLHDEAYYRAQIADMEQGIADAERRLSDWQSEQESTVKKVESIFTKALYKAYVASVAVDDGAWRTTDYAQGIAQLLQDNGVIPAWDTISALYHCVRLAKGTGSSMAETGKHTKAQSETMWRRVFMSTLCDLMGDVLPTYKFVNILTKAQKKAQKKAESANK